MAVFQAFLDESGKFKDHKVVSFCGLAAEVGRMRQFSDEWERLLRRYELPSLTMKRALRINVKLSPQIKAQSPQERIEALKPFADCIREYAEVGIAIAIDVDAYSALSVEAKKRLGGSDDPHYLAFMQGVLGVIKYIPDGDKISIVCDDDESTALNCYKLYRRMCRIEQSARESLVALTFANDDVFVPLQAADFISSLVRYEAHRRFNGKRYDFLPLLRHLTAPPSMKWILSFWDKAHAQKMGQALEKMKLGVTPYGSV